MKSISEFLVDRRISIFFAMLILTAVSLILIPQVTVNTDMTKYLPDSSAMKQGVDILTEEFTGLENLAMGSSTVRVLFRGIPKEERADMKVSLGALPNVGSVSWSPGDERFEKEDYSLYILSFDCDYSSPEFKASVRALKKNFGGRYGMVYATDSTAQQGVPDWILALAVSLLIVILVLMNRSYIEPFLYMASLGVAVAVNTGTDVFLSSVSETTYSISAVLQLALSIDYSIILSSRYRQELQAVRERQGTRGSSGVQTAGLPGKASGGTGPYSEGGNSGWFCKNSPASHVEAMKRAVASAFPSVAGSAMTTVVGLLALVFMSFKIGADMGIVMGKGVFLSMVCAFTVLPALLLFFEPLIGKTQKKELTVSLNAVSRLEYRFRKPVLAVFVLFFIAVFILKGNTGIAFTLVAPNEVDPVFPKENQIVLLYGNDDEEAAAALVRQLEEMPDVKSVFAYSNTLGGSFTPEEMKELLSGTGLGTEIPETLIDALYRGYFGTSEGGRLTPGELVDYAVNTFTKDSIFGRFLTDDMLSLLSGAKDELAEAGGMLRGTGHSLMMISTQLPGESEETAAFMAGLKELCGENLKEAYYLIGDIPMAYEMVDSFGAEFRHISLLTAAAIFLVVLITFRSFAIPLILVALIQSAVYATMVMMNLQGMTIYYLALLVVEGILMGSTIDYGILLTGYYREKRKRLGISESLTEACNASVHTILTSGLAIVAVTGIVGYAFADPAVKQIVHSISKGAALAILLILFLLPGVLAALDSFVTGKRLR